MKKILLGCIMLSALSYAKDYELTFKQLEKEYETLVKKEETLYTNKQNAALKAQEELSKQSELYREVEVKRNKLLEIKDVRFYKEQYESVVNKLSDVMKDLESEMNTQEAVIKEFQTLKKIKEGK